MNKAALVLHKLSEKDGVYSVEYFSAQWKRQRTCQSTMLSDGSSRRLEERLTNLLDIQEKLREAQYVQFHCYL